MSDATVKGGSTKGFMGKYVYTAFWGALVASFFFVFVPYSIELLATKNISVMTAGERSFFYVFDYYADGIKDRDFGVLVWAFIGALGGMLFGKLFYSL